MKKKIFLIHPVLNSVNSHTLVYRKGYGTAIPLGLAYISAFLLKNNYEVKIYDYQVSVKNIYDEIREFEPDIFGISICTPAANIAKNLVRNLKLKYPQIPVIAGGPHISTLKKSIYEETDDYDFLVIGEGEKTIVELISEIFGKKNYSIVKGICYKKENEIKETPPREFIKDLDELPYLPVNLFNFRKYIPTPGTFIHLPNIAFLSSRGCPYSCIFCNKSMFGNTIRQMSADRMIDEIVHLKSKYNVREINYYDDTFTVNKKRVIEFCEKIIQKKIKIKWKCNSRVDTIDKEMLLLMKKAGCFIISYGVESGDDEILKKIKKNISTDEVKNTFKWSKEAGIKRSAFFMINLPGDTRDSIEKTVRFSREINPDFISFELTKPLPGTAIKEALLKEKNINIKENLWNDWDSCTISNKVFYTQNDLTEDYLLKAFNNAVKSFYLTPGFILKNMFSIRSFSQFKSYLIAAINIIRVKALK